MSRANLELKSMFVHLPKCAGSSLSSPEWNRGNGHRTISDFEIECKRKGLERFFKWAFVRNPFDRIVSAYEDCPEIFPHAPTFQKFIDILHANRGELFKIKSLRFTHVPGMGLPIGRIHFMPMHLMLRDSHGDMQVDFVGRYENLEEDFIKVQNHLGIDPSPLPHKNKRANKPNRRNTPWLDLYTPELIEKVWEIYAEDISIFKYPIPDLPLIPNLQKT